MSRHPWARAASVALGTIGIACGGSGPGKTCESYLDIEEVPVRVVCRSCGEGLDLEVPLFVCGACGSADVQVVSGEELCIESMEIDLPEERSGGC